MFIYNCLEQDQLDYIISDCVLKLYEQFTLHIKLELLLILLYK